MQGPTLKTGFPPIVGRSPRLLILGTLPGDASIAERRYYAHPRNQFWPVMADALNEALPASYPACVDMLTRNGVALWDVLASARRQGSLDGAIRGGATNDIGGLLAAEHSIETIAFNGKGAAALFSRCIASDAADALRTMSVVTLPSTSPAHTLRYDKKADAWRVAVRAALAR